jgi:hypothetical protein
MGNIEKVHAFAKIISDAINASLPELHTTVTIFGEANSFGASKPKHVEVRTKEYLTISLAFHQRKPERYMVRPVANGTIECDGHLSLLITLESMDPHFRDMVVNMGMSANLFGPCRRTFDPGDHSAAYAWIREHLDAIDALKVMAALLENN